MADNAADIAKYQEAINLLEQAKTSLATIKSTNKANVYDEANTHCSNCNAAMKLSGIQFVELQRAIKKYNQPVQEGLEDCINAMGTEIERLKTEKAKLESGG